jgi:hypothetical protein
MVDSAYGTSPAKTALFTELVRGAALAKSAKNARTDFRVSLPDTLRSADSHSGVRFL